MYGWTLLIFLPYLSISIILISTIFIACITLFMYIKYYWLFTLLKPFVYYSIFKIGSSNIHVGKIRYESIWFCFVYAGFLTVVGLFGSGTFKFEHTSIIKSTIFLKFLNPKDLWTNKLILLLFASTRALLIPVLMKFRMYSLCLLIFNASSLKESILLLLAQIIQWFNSLSACFTSLIFNIALIDSFNS